MKMTFRWYGEKDKITLDNIRQIPLMTGVVSAVYDTPAGQVWPQSSIDKIKKAANDKGLKFEVVESVPVHEDIKLGAPEAKTYITNYCENIRRLGKAGVKVICYNFMPVFDWLRSELNQKLTDGSFALAYNHAEVLAMDPAKSALSLPGWDESYTKDELQNLLKKYKKIDKKALFSNLAAFLKAIIPVAEGAGVKMAIHPDDPPWDIFGLPRIVSNIDNLTDITKIIDSPSNGVTFCIGSLGADHKNELAKMIKKLKGKIPFVHLRNILLTGDKCFRESAHPSAYGSVDMYAVLKALKDTGFDGYARPDHGRMIWGETGKPGYGLYDRALGSTYLSGLWEAIEKLEK